MDKENEIMGKFIKHKTEKSIKNKKAKKIKRKVWSWKVQ